MKFFFEEFTVNVSTTNDAIDNACHDSLYVRNNPVQDAMRYLPSGTWVRFRMLFPDVGPVADERQNNLRQALIAMGGEEISAEDVVHYLKFEKGSTNHADK